MPEPKLGDWVRPETQALHWAQRIGKIIRIDRSSPHAPTATVKFIYMYTGSKLGREEEFTFPLRRCILVSDFAAIIRSSNPDIILHGTTGFQHPLDEVKYEEIG